MFWETTSMRIRSAFRADDVLSMPLRRLIIVVVSWGKGRMPLEGEGTSWASSGDGEAQLQHGAADQLGFKLVLQEILVELHQLGLELDGVAIFTGGDGGWIDGQLGLEAAEASGILGSQSLVQFGGKGRRDIHPLVMRGFQVGQVAGDGLVAQ